MTAAGMQPDWTSANQRHITSAVEVVRALLSAHVGAAGAGDDTTDHLEAARRQLCEADQAMPSPSALDGITAAFGLSTFERDILTLCAGIELSGDFGQAVAAALGDPRSVHPTFGLALAALPDPHWSAITASAPLRRWRMIELLHGDTLTTSPIRIDERILHFLAGVRQLDPTLMGLTHPAPTWERLPPSLHSLAHRVAGLISRPAQAQIRSAIQLHGPDRSAVLAVAAAALAELGQRLFVIRVADVPAGSTEREALARSLEREEVLEQVAWLLDVDDADSPESVRSSLALVASMAIPTLLASREPVKSGSGSSVTVSVETPGTSEQRDLWDMVLGPARDHLDGTLEPILAQFALSLPSMQAASIPILGRVETGGGEAGDEREELGRLLWDACREQARPRMEDLTQRIPPVASWDDIVLPGPQIQTLREIATHVRQRMRVYEEWGFGARSARGLGISALFAGPSGTGKTMAAEVIAQDLRLDLYRIDLSQVVSKYIGETEKNLRRVFDAAEQGGAVLLFDEADALFGKRSEVKDSHDRYANIEVSYLLQRMEAYRGLAILTTNMKSALDPAFLRRIRFVIQFPFPDVAQRAEIWSRIFPADTPTEGLDPFVLARLGVAGGNIRNIALNAAFLAADAGEPVAMPHLLRAARSEYAKLEKPLTDAEVGSWA